MPRRRPAWWWPAVMGACLLSLLIHGYFLHGGDNDAWLPFVQHAADPGLYAADPFVAGPLGQLSYHVVVMGHASRLFVDTDHHAYLHS